MAIVRTQEALIDVMVAVGVGPALVANARVRAPSIVSTSAVRAGRRRAVVQIPAGIHTVPLKPGFALALK